MPTLLTELTLALAFFASFSQEQLTVVNICEILAAPTKFSGRLVAVRGIVELDLRSETACAKTLITDGRRWPPAIALAEMREPREAFSGRLGDESFERFAEFLNSYRARGEQATVRATFVGKLRAREKYEAGTAGFGLFSLLPAELLVYAVRDKVLIRTSPAKPLIK